MYTEGAERSIQKHDIVEIPPLGTHLRWVPLGRNDNMWVGKSKPTVNNMKLLYNLFFILFSILYLPYLIIKGKGHRDFFQKFGFLPKSITSIERPVWIHAVSVGEAVLAAKLAQAIKEKTRDIPVIVSTTTSTGNDMIRKVGKGCVDEVFYYPLDLSFVVKKIVRLIGPRVYVMVETELWPNLLEELDAKNVPVILVNGRISDSSFKNYRRIKFITRRILKCIRTFCMQSDVDAERIQSLGADERRITVTGNIKFDTPVLDPKNNGLDKRGLGFAEEDRVLVAGSTHYPEETAIIDIYKNLRKEVPNLKLVLAPRHIERIDAIKVYLDKNGLLFNKFTEISGEKDILLVDTIGHLKDIYSIADVVFIGGSIAKKGGQNPIEAASWGKVTVFGPNMHNFREITDILLRGNAAIKVEDENELKNVLKKLLIAPKIMNDIIANAVCVIEKSKGAISKTVDAIGEVL